MTFSTARGGQKGVDHFFLKSIRIKNIFCFFFLFVVVVWGRIMGVLRCCCVRCVCVWCGCGAAGGGEGGGQGWTVKNFLRQFLYPCVEKATPSPPSPNERGFFCSILSVVSLSLSLPHPTPTFVFRLTTTKSPHITL